MSGMDRTLPRTERGAFGFREEKTQAQGWAAATSLVMLAFLVCMAEVWVATEVAQTRSRVVEFEAKIEKIAVDIAVAEAQSRREGIDVQPYADRVGLVPDGARQAIALPPASRPEVALPTEPVLAGVVRSTRLMWSEASAEDRPTRRGRGTQR